MSCVSYRVSTSQTVGEIYRFWSVANWNRPHHMLEPARVKRLKGYAQYCDEVNMVYLLGGRLPGINAWYKGVDDNGRVIADFSGMIEQIQAAMDNGYTPWLVLDNTPYEMSSPPSENFYGNTAPPDNWDHWHQYVKGAIQAMVDAFGMEVVKNWWFRVGTEPDLLPGHWCGTKEEYFKHYDYTVDAVLSVIPEAMIGPGNILNPVEGEYGIVVRDQWGLDIIDHCATGINACTGQTGTEMRWFSTSWYGRITVPLSMFDKAIGMMRERLGRYSRFADIPLIIGEFTVLHDENGKRLYNGDTTEWSTSFYAGIADRVYKHQLTKVYEWHHGTEGVLHPKGHVVWMLEQMAGGDLLKKEPELDADVDHGVIACRKSNELYLLIYHHDTQRTPGESKQFEITLDLPHECVEKVKEWTVSREHASWAYEFEADCKAAGLVPDEKIGRYEGGIEYSYGDPGFEIWNANCEKYAKLSVMPETNDVDMEASDDGQVKLTINMPGHCVRFVKMQIN